AVQRVARQVGREPHHQEVLPHRRRRRHAGRPRRPGDPGRGPQGRVRHRARARRDLEARPRREAEAVGPAGRNVLHLEPRRDRRHRVYPHHQRPGSGDPLRVARRDEAGLERKRVRAAARPAALDFLRSPGDRRCHRGALQRLPRLGPLRHPEARALMAATEVKVPDIGDFQEVEVIEVLVKPGDAVTREQSLITLESDKATMEIPSPEAGVVKALRVKVGDKVSKGTPILDLEAEGAGTAQAAQSEKPEPARAEKPQSGKAEPSKAETAKARQADPQGAADLECDVLVLGAGPGGYSAAFRAADLGLKTVLVERYDSLGGVCLNVGCIPSKALLHTAAIIDAARSLAAHGVAFGEPKIDLAKLRAFKDKVVGKLTGGL